MSDQWKPRTAFDADPAKGEPVNTERWTDGSVVERRVERRALRRFGAENLLDGTVMLTTVWAEEGEHGFAYSPDIAEHEIVPIEDLARKLGELAELLSYIAVG